MKTVITGFYSRLAGRVGALASVFEQAPQVTLGESMGPMSRLSMGGQIGSKVLSEMLEMPMWDGVCVCVFRDGK